MGIDSPQKKSGTTVIRSSGKNTNKIGRSDGTGSPVKGFHDGRITTNYPVTKSAPKKRETGIEPLPQNLRGYELVKKIKDKPITSANTAPDGTRRTKKL